MKNPNFYLLTDTHLLSKDVWVEGKPITGREKNDQIALKLSPEILDSFIDIIINDKETQNVVFLGDNVNGGDLASHADFKKRLDFLSSAGKRVFVMCATHDYCSPNGEDECFQHDSSRYTETGTEDIPFMYRRDLFDYYCAYGPDQAISVDEESKSYVVQLGEGVRLCMICDNGNGRSHCGLFEGGMNWLKDQIADAKAAGDFILLAVHHPVIPPWEVFAHVVDYEMFGGYKQLSELMSSEGVRVVFTGHVHEQSIRKFESENGGYFFNVATVAAVNAAGKMRKVCFDTEKGTCSVTSVGLSEIKGVDLGGKSPFEYLYYINLPGLAEKFVPAVLEDFDKAMEIGEGPLPVEKMKKHKHLVRFAVKRASNLTLYSAAKFGKTKRKLSPPQRSYAKQTKLLGVMFEILRHIYAGNAPYNPETVEYIALTGVTDRLGKLAERFKVKKVLNLIPPGSSLPKMAEDFLYNNRTGDDDTIEINLK